MRHDMLHRAKMGAVDSMLGSLDDVDEQRLRERKTGAPLEDGHPNDAQLPEEDSQAMNMGGLKGSDADVDEETLWQPKAAPNDSAQMPESEGDEWKELRDAAAAGDDHARRILEVIDQTGDAMGEDSDGDNGDDEAALDKSESDEHVTSQTDTTENDSGTGWEEDEEVQDGTGMYRKVDTRRRPSQSSSRGR